MTFQTFTGKEYLKIDVASSYGLDKKEWQERIDWFEQHESSLETLVSQAKEPALFYAGVQAWRATQKKEPVGYMISLDATSSGLQLLACLTGDVSAARLCNVIDTGTRNDAYTLIYQEMLSRIGEEGRITRDKTKDAIMTALYSSKAVPKQVFGEGALLDIFYTTLSDLAPGAWELNEAFLDMWNPDALSHDWTLPDNFHVKVKVMGKTCETIHVFNQPYEIYTKVNAAMDSGRSLGANTIHSLDGMIVREMSRRCGYNPKTIANVKDALELGHGTFQDEPDDKMVIALWKHYEESGFLSARILDHIDRGNIGHIDKAVIKQLIDSLPEKPFTVISIHDCFRCLANYGNDLRWQYTNLLALISKSEMLSFLVSQLLGRKVIINKMNSQMHSQVRHANYALS